jgi:hypothetical protein
VNTTGLDIPVSFREHCKCCAGSGEHLVCELIPHKCMPCDGTGWTLNQLGRDLYRALERERGTVT